MALIKNTQPVPTATMSSPATAGPAIRATLNVIELSATALATWSGPTISTANACRTGTSIAEKQPSTTHSR